MIKMIFPIITVEEEKLPFYITSTGANENQNHMQRPEGYPNYHFLYCTAGLGKLLIDGKDFKIAENTGFFFHPDIPHEYYAEVEPWTTWWITFDGYGVKELLNRIGLGIYDIFRISDMEKLRKLYMEAHSEAVLARPSKSQKASLVLYRFLLELKSCIGAENIKTSSGKYQQLHPLLVMIEENYNKSITLNEMAEVANITPQHLCRLFRQAFNMRPFEYLTRFRLQKAKGILVGSENLTLKEIADITGYNDTSYLCSVFRQYEGMTPIEFKRMHREI